jgi:putative MATE family efflux protein
MLSTPSTPPSGTDSDGGAPLLKLSPGRAVWAVGWPMIALGLLKSCYFLTDSYWVGRLGDSELAALGGAAFAWWMIFIVCDLGAVGTHALSARHEGAGRRERIRPTLTQGLWVAAAVGLLLATVVFPTRGLYFDLLDFAAGSAEHLRGQEYLGASLLGSITLALHAVVGAVFRGIGDTRTALWIAAVTLAVNAVLDPLFIWGLGPVPELGIAGAAWATTASNLVGTVVGLAVLASRRLLPKAQGPELKVVALIARIGTPVTASGLGFSLVYVILGRFINDFGTEHMAALGVGHRLESLAYLFSVGLMVGAATMVGQHLGAGNPKLAARSAHAAAGICTAGMVPIAILLFALAGPMMDVFTDDPAIVAAGVHYLRIQALFVVFMGIEIVYEGGFSGAGDTMPSFWITAVGTAARIPLAWLFAYHLGWGIGGVWWAIAVTTLAKGIVLPAWFLRGRWATALSDEDLGPTSTASSPAPVAAPPTSPA